MSASREKKQRQDVAGGGLTEKQRREQQEAAKARAKKAAYWIVGIIIAVLVVALLVWNSGFFQRRTVAATVDGKDYTVADVSYYYYNAKSNQDYMSRLYAQYGMSDGSGYDPDKAPADQIQDAETGKTFDQYFKEQAVEALQYEAMMLDQAKAENYTLSADGQKQVDDTIANFKNYAAQNNVSLKTYLRAVFGPYVTEGVFKEHVKNSTLASEFEQHQKDSYEYTDADLEAYYEQNSGSLDTFDYRLAFISGTPETETDADGNTVEPTDEQKATAMSEAKAKADAMAALVKGGADFNETAKQYVADTAAAQYDDPEYNHQTGRVGNTLASTSYGAWLTEGNGQQTGAVGVVEESGGTGYYVVQVIDRFLDEETHYSSEIRHILVKAEVPEEPEATPAPSASVDPESSAAPETTPAPENTEPVAPTEDQYAAAKAKIEEIKAEFEAGDKTPESFGALADQYSEDPGSNGSSVDEGGASGGYYEVTQDTNFFADFKNWALDPARKAGDLGIIQNTQTDQWGYHLIYFQDWGPIAWKHTAQTALASEDYQTWYDGLTPSYETAQVEEGMSMVG